MTSPRGNTVTLQVAQGESQHPTATFSSAMAARQVAVGSGPEAQWKIRGHGVEPIHAELYWDGNILWARDAGSLSGVYVGQARADEWQQVFDATEVLLGSAVLRAKVVGPDARAPAAEAPAKATSVGFLDEEESTEVFSNQHLSEALKGMAQPAAPMQTNTAGRLATQAPPRPSVPQIPSLPLGNGVASPAPLSVPPSPPMGAPVMAPPRPQGTTPAPASGVSEATVIRQSPYAAMESGGGLTPRAGGPVGMGPVGAHDRPDERTVMANPGELLANVGVAMPVVQPRAATMAPPLAPGLQPMMPNGFGVMNNPLAPPMASPSPISMAPPPMGEHDDPFGPMELPPPPKGSSGGLTSLPPRTLALAGIVLTLCAVLLMMGPAQRQQSAAGPARQQYLVRTMGATAPTTNNILQLPIVTIPQGQAALVGVIVPAPMSNVDATGRARPFPPPNAADPIRVAAEAVAANRYADAAGLYEQLAAAHPEAPLFRQFAAVLRARASQHCQPGVAGCAPAAPAAPTPSPPAAAPAAAPTP